MKTVLVIDDDPLSLNIVTGFLRRQHFRVIPTEDSSEALMLVLNERPDAIVTDIDMPGMSGWELIRVIRSWTRTALIPVIFLTQLGSEDDRTLGFRLGADDYLTKPVRPDALVTQLTNIIEASEMYLKHVRRKLANDEEISETVSMFGIPSFLSLLEEAGKTGLITMEHGDQRAQFSVCGGKIHHAVMRSDPTVQGLNCIFQALQWPSGVYHFKSGPIVCADLISRSTTQILTEIATAGGEGACAVGLRPSQSGHQVAVTRVARHTLGAYAGANRLSAG